MEEGMALMLRTCDAERRGYGGFQWPESGLVEAPDWSPEPICGRGLHGLLWGEQDGSLLNWDVSAVWLVCEVEVAALVDIGGKVKVPRAWVVYCGTREGATQYIVEHGGHGRAIHGYTATAGYAGTATSGVRGTATAGVRGTATAGVRGTATAGDEGTATAGYAGTATAGYAGTAAAGDAGTATAGVRGTATAGVRGTATAGYEGTATAGDEGEIRIRWYDGRRYRVAVGYVGEDGIEANVPYIVREGKLAKKSV